MYSEVNNLLFRLLFVDFSKILMKIVKCELHRCQVFGKLKKKNCFGSLLKLFYLVTNTTKNNNCAIYS